MVISFEAQKVAEEDISLWTKQFEHKFEPEEKQSSKEL